MPNSLISCSYDNTIRLWEGEDDDYLCKQTLEGHNSIVWSLVQAEQGRVLFSTSEDCRVIQWNLNEETERFDKIAVIEGLHWLPIYTACLLDSQYLVTVSCD